MRKFYMSAARSCRPLADWRALRCRAKRTTDVPDIFPWKTLLSSCEIYASGGNFIRSAHKHATFVLYASKVAWLSTTAVSYFTFLHGKQQKLSVLNLRPDSYVVELERITFIQRFVKQNTIDITDVTNVHITRYRAADDGARGPQAPDRR